MTGTGGPLRLGTRGSELAVSQTLTVAGRIEELTGAETELVRVRTEGDDLSIPLSAPPRPGAFAARLRDVAEDAPLTFHRPSTPSRIFPSRRSRACGSSPCPSAPPPRTPS